jgi:hypothetical protein
MTLSQKSLSLAIWKRVVSNVTTTILKSFSLALPLFQGMVTPVQSESEVYTRTLEEKKYHIDNPRYFSEYFEVPRLGHDLYLMDPVGND